jgi:hypothetical protein
MLRSDFAWVNFDNEFNVPNEEATRTFTIDDDPAAASAPGSSVRAEGYILIQARDVGNSSAGPGDSITHRILINGRHLPSFDMVAEDGWNLWMDRIPVGFLQQGQNRLTIRRRAVDNFAVANVVVHWREGQPSVGGVTGPGNVTAEPVAG